MNRFFIVVPVYNEQKNIRRCIKNIQKYWKKIIIVDDGSTDDTLKILRTFRSIEVVTLKKNMGKGHAMMVGAKQAWKIGAKGIVFMDGDRQHNPVHIPSFIALLKKHDVIIGIRLLKTNIPFHRKIGNLIIVSLMRIMFNMQISDIMCGFRAMTQRGFNKIRWKSQRYGVEVEMLTTISKKKIPYKTIVVETIYHDNYKGFSLYDGIKIIFNLPYWKLS